MKAGIFGEVIDGQHYIEREGVYGLLFDDAGKIAVIETPRGYFLPGGGIEGDESHQECVIREFLEETGHEVSVSHFVCEGALYGIAPNIMKYMKLTGFFYKVGLTGKTIAKIEEDHDLKWIDTGEAVELLKLENQAWAVAVAVNE